MDDFGGAYDYSWALKFDECIRLLKELGMDPFPKTEEEIHCNATYDGITCWPAIPVNTYYVRPCPIREGFDPQKSVSKACHSSGRWQRHPNDDDWPSHGWTNYTSCLANNEFTPPDDFVVEFQPTVRTQAETVVWTPGVPSISSSSEMPILSTASEPSVSSMPVVSSCLPDGATSRILAHVGVSLSIVCLIAALAYLCFSKYRRRQLTLVRCSFMASLLAVFLLRLILQTDYEFLITGGGLIYGQMYVCDSFIWLLEWCKLLTNVWLGAVCVHGLFESCCESQSQSIRCILFYRIFALAFTTIALIVWLILLLAVDSEGASYECFRVQNSTCVATISIEYLHRTPSKYLLLGVNFFALLVAVTCSLIHALLNVVRQCCDRAASFRSSKWNYQVFTHCLLATYMSLVWFCDTWVHSKVSRNGYNILPEIRSSIIAFAGVFVAVFLSIAQRYLPLKEVVHC